MLDIEVEETTLAKKDQMTQAARLGLRLFEDLTAVASGGPVSSLVFFTCQLLAHDAEIFVFCLFINIQAAWLRVTPLQRTFVLDMLE